MIWYQNRFSLHTYIHTYIHKQIFLIYIYIYILLKVRFNRWIKPAYLISKTVLFLRILIVQLVLTSCQFVSSYFMSWGSRITFIICSYIFILLFQRSFFSLRSNWIKILFKHNYLTCRWNPCKNYYFESDMTGKNAHEEHHTPLILKQVS